MPLKQTCFPSTNTDSLKHSARASIGFCLNTSSSIRPYRVFSDESVPPVSVAFTIFFRDRQTSVSVRYPPSISKRCRSLVPAALDPLLPTQCSVSRTLHTAFSMFCTVFFIFVNGLWNVIPYYCLTKTVKCAKSLAAVSNMLPSLSKYSTGGSRIWNFEMFNPDLQCCTAKPRTARLNSSISKRSFDSSFSTHHTSLWSNSTVATISMYCTFIRVRSHFASNPNFLSSNDATNRESLLTT